MVGHTISCSARADHGISPAQLREKVERCERLLSGNHDLACAGIQFVREKVEELEKRFEVVDVNHTVAFRNVAKELYERLDALEAKYQGVCEHGDEMESRLVAALERIQQLEEQQARWHSNASHQPEVDET